MEILNVPRVSFAAGFHLQKSPIVCGGADVTDDAAEEDPEDIVEAVEDGRAGG